MNIEKGTYRHFKGNLYEVVGFAKSSETCEDMVIYKALYGEEETWVRPASMWDETIERDGQVFKRFTNIRDIKAKPINNYSSPEEKIELFSDVFACRQDVFAKRWETKKKGTFGYSPCCGKEWRYGCPKLRNKGAKCGDCLVPAFDKYDKDSVGKHLLGEIVIAGYPSLNNQTCKFVAFDLTNSSEAKAIMTTCKENDLNCYLERNRTGDGYHIWIFFNQFTPLECSAEFCKSVIDLTIQTHSNISFDLYDSFTPSQSIVPKGGFGSSIELPLQKNARKDNNSEFLDENFKTIEDQWDFLFNIKKHNLNEIENFIQKANLEYENLEATKEIKGIKSNMISVEKKNLSIYAQYKVKQLASFENPDFEKHEKMKLSTFGIPRYVTAFEEDEKYIYLPRALDAKLDERFSMVWQDKRNDGHCIDANFNGKLKPQQQEAVDEMTKHENGVLAATTAFGKTVVAAAMIAKINVNTLILVHRSNLLEQWKERLNQFLPSSPIGEIGGGKFEPTGAIDVAIMQSLNSEEKIAELADKYGMIIVDECHHASANSFRNILKSFNAKYVYGLTATPDRQDGQSASILLHCGDIRYVVSAKEQAKLRPFDHYIIPRYTDFSNSATRSENSWHITEIYESITNDEARNRMIIADVIKAIKDGKNPIILTERTAHVDYLKNELAKFQKNVIALTGGLTKKKSKEILDEVASIPKNESFALVATGKYIGEGFDMPRLDTLFLAMPISWEGTLQQYAGRLHRLYESKLEVNIYDYVDYKVKMLEKMFQKRLIGYEKCGYRVRANI